MSKAKNTAIKRIRRKQSIRGRNIVAGIIIVIVSIFLFIDLNKPKICNLNNANPRQILTSDGFSLDNQMNSDLQASSSTDIVQADNIIYGVFWSCGKFIGIDIDSQELAIQLDFHMPDFSYNADENLIYVVNDPIASGSSITAINSEHKLVWTNQVTNRSREWVSLFIDSNGTDYINAQTQGFRSLNIATGELGDPISIPEGVPWSNFYDGYFWRIYSGRLEAYEVENNFDMAFISNYNDLLWALYQVWANDDVIVLRVNSAITVLSRDEGDLLWHYDNTEIISNIQVLDGQIFALDMNANLLRFNMMTGTITGSITFAAPSESARDSRPNSGVMDSSQIALSSEFITIYFGDSGILSSYRWSD